MRAPAGQVTISARMFRAIAADPLIVNSGAAAPGSVAAIDPVGGGHDVAAGGMYGHADQGRA